MSTQKMGLKYRLQTVSRILLGTVGGYILSAAMTLWTERIIPAEPEQAAIASNMLFFIYFICAVIWAFSNISLKKAYLGICVPGCVLWVALLISGGIS